MAKALMSYASDGCAVKAKFSDPLGLKLTDMFTLMITIVFRTLLKSVFAIFNRGVWLCV